MEWYSRGAATNIVDAASCEYLMAIHVINSYDEFLSIIPISLDRSLNVFLRDISLFPLL